MRIDVRRIAADLELIGGMTETPGTGSSRPTFSPQWAEARDYIIKQASAAGCNHAIDAAGNVHIRQAAFGWNDRAWLSGSHIDSVPHGGKFDGVVGVVIPLELFRAAFDAKQIIPLELIIFAEEEGTTFNLGMLGSRAWAGTLTMDDLARLHNRDGVSPLDAGKPYGVIADNIGTNIIKPENYFGFIEVHVEQGPAMWEQNIPIAIVDGIHGRCQFECTLSGVANHAGSTPMNYRKDSLAGAAQIICALESLPGTSLGTHGWGQQSVLTVGQLNNRPNAINVIPGRTQFTIDFRTPNAHLLQQAATEIEQIVRSIADHRGLAVDFRQTETLPATSLDTNVIRSLRDAADRIGLRLRAETSSGALHDAAILAPYLPTAMIFVASKDGISHNPQEFSRIEDIASAAALLAEVVAA